MKGRTYFAVDLGATSGRTIIASINEGKIEQEELTRFPNDIIELNGHFYWDILRLYNEIIRGLRLAAERGLDIASIGIDTWGVDFSCFGPDGHLLGNPISYRDPQTTGMIDAYFREVMPAEKVYGKTGIQFMYFNSLFQFFAMRKAENSVLNAADKILFTPDALSYMLTGRAVCEYTIASTSQLLNPQTANLDEELLQSLSLCRGQFGEMVPSGTVIGTLTEEVQHMTGLGPVPVVAVAGHDTASAVAAIPAEDEHFAYLSSGTWSLMGIESPKAIINAQSFERNFTNEGGIEGTTRFLKNICGMWLYERCRKEWPEEVRQMGHQQLQASAMEAEAFRSFINPDDAVFANPKSMLTAIKDYCRNTNQPIPETPAEICRCIFDSLAMRYRQVFSWLCEFADFDIHTLHIIGGGSMNVYLDQFTANACGVRVKAGPQECTAIGNIMLQAKAAGDVSDIWAMRSIIARSVEPRIFEPQDTAQWSAAYERYLAVTGNQNQ